MLFDERAENEPDPTEHEPEEWDPEADIEVPEAPSVRPLSEVPDHLKREFVTLVVIFNVALLTFSLGLMFIGFEGRLGLGGGLVLVGVLSFARGYHKYKHREYQ